MPLQYINPGVAMGDAVLASQERRRIMAEQQSALARQIQQEQFENSIKSRSASVNEGNLDVSRGRLGEDVRQFDAQAPTRTAGVAHTQAQTAGLTQDQGIKSENRAGTLRLINSLPDQAPGPGRPSPRTAAGLSFMGGVDFMTPAGERALVPAADLGRETGQSAGAAWNAGGRGVFAEQERMRGDQDVRVAGARQAAASSQATPQELDGVAAMVLQDPETLKALDVKTRTAVVLHMANSPQGSALAQKRTALTDRMKSEALAMAQALRTDPAKGWSVGAQGPGTAFGLMDEPLPGSDQSGFRKKLSGLMAKLALPNLQMMRGLGALSDAEGARIQSATTSLSHTTNEGDFDAELDAIIQSLGGGNGQTGPAVGTRRMINGQLGEWDGRGWKPVR